MFQLQIQNCITLFNYQKQYKNQENHFYAIILNDQRNYKTSNKIDQNNFTHRIQDSYLLVLIKQILLSIEQTNNGELEEKGEYTTEGEFLEMKDCLM